MNVSPSSSALRRAVSAVRPARSAITAASIALGLLVASSAHAEFTTPVASYGVSGVATFSAGPGFVLREMEPGGLVAAATTDSSERLYVLYRALPPTDSVSHLYLVRIDAAGVLDSGFARLDFGQATAIDGDVALALDESRQRLYLISLPPVGPVMSITVSARRFDNSLDPTFNGGNDLIIVPGRTVDNRVGFSATVDQTTGRLVLGGAFVVSSGDTRDAMTPLLANRVTVTYVITPEGLLDTAFNSNGLKIQSRPDVPSLLSTVSFGAATGADGRVFNLGVGLVAGERYVGTVFSDLADGSTDAGFNGNGLQVIDLAPATAPPAGQSNLTQLLFGRVLASGTTQFVGLIGQLDTTTLNYVPGGSSAFGVQFTRDGTYDLGLNGSGMVTAPIDLSRSPPVALFADGSIAAVFRANDNQISARVLEGFRGSIGGGTTTGGTTSGETTGGTTTGSTTGGTTTGGTTGDTTTGGTTGGSTTGGTTTGGTTTGGSTTGGSTTGTSTGGTTTGGSSSSSGGGGSFGLFGVVGLMIGALLRRRRGFGVVRGA